MRYWNIGSATTDVAGDDRVEYRNRYAESRCSYGIEQLHKARVAVDIPEGAYTQHTGLPGNLGQVRARAGDHCPGHDPIDRDHVSACRRTLLAATPAGQMLRQRLFLGFLGFWLVIDALLLHRHRPSPRIGLDNQYI